MPLEVVRSVTDGSEKDTKLGSSRKAKVIAVLESAPVKSTKYYVAEP